MNAVEDQLAATRANLERLEKLAADCPDLFEYASGPSIEPDAVTVYLHANIREEARAVDWPAVARKYRDAGWKRVSSAAYHCRWDWHGELNGVRIRILGVEAVPEAQPLFIGEAA